MVILKLFQSIFCFCLAAETLLAWNSPTETEIAVNEGENVTLACFLDGQPEKDPVMWVKEDKSERISHWFIQEDASLSLANVARDDSGVYTCAADNSRDDDEQDRLAHDLVDNIGDTIRAKYRLRVRTTPGELVNVTVHASTVLALLLWDVGDTGGSEISHFTARYRLTHAVDWLDVMPRHISPSTRQIDIYHLSPNSSYIFQLWATNIVGPGEKVTVEATTKHVVQEIELARHLLQGVETFDTRVWVVAVSVVMGTLLVLSLGTCYLMFRDHHVTVWSGDEQEVMELVPNIILNPGFLDDPDRVVHDENSSDQPHVAFHSNSVVTPIRV